MGSENRGLKLPFNKDFQKLLKMDRIKRITPVKSIKEVKNIQEIDSIEEIDEDVAESFIKTHGLVNTLDESEDEEAENRIVPALPDSEEDSPGNSEISKIKKEIENEDEIVNILQGGIEKERQRLKVLEDVKQSHDDTRNSKIEEYNKLVQELENRNMIDSSEEVEDIQV